MATRGAGTITAVLRHKLPEPAAAGWQTAALPACSSAHSRWFATARASISAEVSPLCRHASPFRETAGIGVGPSGGNAYVPPPPPRAACACAAVWCTTVPFIRHHDGCDAQPAGSMSAPTAPHMPAAGLQPRAVADLLTRLPPLFTHARYWPSSRTSAVMPWASSISRIKVPSMAPLPNSTLPVASRMRSLR